MKFLTHIIILSLMAAVFSTKAQAQGSDLYGKGIRLNLNEDGSKYMRIITWHQVWARGIRQNPGTSVNGENRDYDFDLGIRRSRMLFLTQISPRFLILTHFGINNQTFVNGGGSGTSGTGGYGAGKKPQIFFHDMWTEYMVVKDKLYFGAGLHYWNGVSRISSASTLNFMALDAPIFNWALIEESDQFARQMGVYAKGKLGKLDYRLSLNKPYATPNTEANLKTSPNRAFSYQNNNWAFSGYVGYEFFEKESNVLPFYVGTYLGTKKVFNIGFGWHYHPQATQSFNSVSNQTEKHDMKLFGIDAFLDMPINKEKGTAITWYAGAYSYDFGKNYIRSVGIMNIGAPSANGGVLPQGAGNADFRIGTGQIVYSELGYLFPKEFITKSGRIQAFGTYTMKNFEFLKNASNDFGAGFNYFLEGHNAKISLKYQTRAIYSNSDRNYDSSGYNPAAFDLTPGSERKLELNRNPNVFGGKSHAGEWILQFMIYL